MDENSRREAALGVLICVLPITVIALWVASTRPTAEPSAYTTPSGPAITWTPVPQVSIPEDLTPAEQDCGDGTEGTFAECWQRAREQFLARLRTDWPTPSAPDWPTPSAPVAVPSLAPPALTVCADGSISHSTGSGTCSWHGGIG